MNPIEIVIKNQEDHLTWLKSQAASFGGSPVMTQDQIKLAVAQAMAQSSPYGAILGKLAEAARQSLPPDQYAWFVSHVSEGMPGMTPFLQSQAIKDVIQLAAETYLAFIQGKVK